MRVKKKLFMVFFFIIGQVSFLHSADFTPPTVGFDSNILPPVAPVIQVVPIDAIKDIMGSLASNSSESLSHIFLKGSVGYLPHLVLGGALLYGGSIAVKKIIESLKDVIKMPGRTKKIDEGVVKVSEKLESHITDFNVWKDNLWEKILKVEFRIVENIKDFVTKLFEGFAKEQKQAVANVQTSLDETQQFLGKMNKDLQENIALVTQVKDEMVQHHTETLKKIEKSKEESMEEIKILFNNAEDNNNQKHQTLSGQLETQASKLDGIYTSILELQNHLGDVPEHMAVSKEVEGALLERTENIQKKTEENNTILANMSGQKSSQAMTVSNNRGPSLSGSGILNYFKPELTKISQEQERLEHKLEDFKEEKLLSQNLLLEKVELVVQQQMKSLSLQIASQLAAAQAKNKLEKKKLKRERDTYRALACAVMFKDMNNMQAQVDSSFSCQVRKPYAQPRDNFSYDACLSNFLLGRQKDLFFKQQRSFFSENIN